MEDNKSSYGNILKSTFLFSFVQVVRILVGVIKNKIVAILLGSEGMGVMGLFNNAIFLIKTGAGLGISQSAIRDISEAKAAGDQTRTSKIISIVRKLSIFTALLGLVITIVFSSVLSIFEFGNTAYTLSFIFLSVSIFFEVFVENQLSILKGTRQLKSLAKASIFGAFIGLLSGVPLYFIMGIDGIVPSFVISSFTIYLVTRYFVDKTDYSKNKIPFKEVIKESTPMVKMGCALMFTTLISMIVNFIIAGYMSTHGGLKDVGYYNAGMAIINSYFGVIITALTTDYYPRIAAINKDNAKLAYELNKQSLVSILLTSPLIVLFILLLPFFVELLYSSEFLPIVDFMKVAMFYTLITIVSNQADLIVVAKFDIKTFTIIAVIMRVFQVLSSIYFYEKFGIIGLGIAEVLRAVLHLVTFVIIDYIKYDIKFNVIFIQNAIIVSSTTLIAVAIGSINDIMLRCTSGVILLIFSLCYLYIASKKYMGINFYNFVKSKINKR